MNRVLQGDGKRERYSSTGGIKTAGECGERAVVLQRVVRVGFVEQKHRLEGRGVNSFREKASSFHVEGGARARSLVRNAFGLCRNQEGRKGG